MAANANPERTTAASESPDPIALFGEWFERAAAGAPFDPTECALATVDPSGRPSVRIVLVKRWDERGFRFFTNYESRKGRELAADPRAALCWRWAWREQQVRVEGEVERLPAAESDAYFAARPRGHQIGAWASAQSRPIASPAELEAAVASVEERFAGRDVPRPPHWGGFVLKPLVVEFWLGRPDRLHQRTLLRLRDGAWSAELLSP